MSPWFVIETLLLALVFFASFLVAWDAIHSAKSCGGCTGDGTKGGCG
jgi:hypothetical protein